MLDKLESVVSPNNKLKFIGYPVVERALNIIPECITVNFWLPVGLNLILGLVVQQFSGGLR